MDPSPSPDPTVSPLEAEALLDIAAATLDDALAGRPPALPALGSLPDVLHRPTGAFVTLTVAGRLNGCIGTIEGREPLGHAVARLALSAAFEDPRLPALRPEDRAHLTIELSLLSPLTPVTARSRTELLEAVRPGHDGLVVEAGRRRGLFLPSVWDQIPRPEDFLDHLWHKADLRPRSWPEGLRLFRFVTQRHERCVGTDPATTAA